MRRFEIGSRVRRAMTGTVEIEGNTVRATCRHDSGRTTEYEITVPTPALPDEIVDEFDVSFRTIETLASRETFRVEADTILYLDDEGEDVDSEDVLAFYEDEDGDGFIWTLPTTGQGEVWRGLAHGRHEVLPDGTVLTDGAEMWSEG